MKIGLRENTAPAVAVVLFICALAYAFQGSRGLWAPDEGRYVAGATSMLQTGDMLVARIGHEPYLNKPPFTFWGIAGGLKLFGWNEWGARAFHALCFILTALIVGHFAKELWGLAEGLQAALLYATMVAPFASGNIITPDIPLTMWTAAAMLSFWKSLHAPKWRGLWKVALGFALGMGMLTKGPAALIPTSAMFLFLVFTGQVLSFFVSLWLLLGAVVCLGCAGWWYALVIRDIPGAADYIWNSQFWGRLVSDEYRRSPGVLNGLKIYGPMLILGSLPWSIPAVIYFWRSRPAIRTPQWWLGLKKRPVALFLLLWLVAPTLVLTAASSKLPFYILPVFPGLVLVASHLIYREWTAKRATGTAAQVWQVFRWAAMVGVVLTGLKFIGAHVDDTRDMRAAWLALRERLPAAPHRLVAVDADLKGLAFYARESVSEAATSLPYPDFVPAKPVDQEIRDAKNSQCPRVFLFQTIRESSKRWHGVPLTERLHKAGLGAEEFHLPGAYTAVMSTPAAKGSAKATLAFVFEKGDGGLAAFNAANTLYLLARENALQGVVFMEPAFAEPQRREAAWAPYRRIVGTEPPLYAGLSRLEKFGDLVTAGAPDAQNARTFVLGGVAFTLTADAHLQVRAKDESAVTDHDLLANLKSSSATKLLADRAALRGQLLLLVSARAGVCEFRLYDTVHAELAVLFAERQP